MSSWSYELGERFEYVRGRLVAGLDDWIDGSETWVCVELASTVARYDLRFHDGVLAGSVRLRAVGDRMTEISVRPHHGRGVTAGHRRWFDQVINAALGWHRVNAAELEAELAGMGPGPVHPELRMRRGPNEDTKGKLRELYELRERAISEGRDIPPFTTALQSAGGLRPETAEKYVPERFRRAWSIRRHWDYSEFSELFELRNDDG